MKLTLPKEYNFLIPLTPKSLVRMGVKKDGGYVVNEELINKSRTLVSFGMGNEFSFEKEFLVKDIRNKVFIYDFSINHFHYLKELLKNIRRILKFKRNLNHLKKWFLEYFYFTKFTLMKKVNFFSRKVTSKINSKEEVNLNQIFESPILLNEKNITLKIDIEGSEYDIIDDILYYEKQINQLIIEYHDTHLRKEEFFENILKLKKYFEINHLHPNNFNKLNQDGFSINIEITFSNKRQNAYKGIKRYSFPIPNLDYPNDPTKPDLAINFNDKHQ